MFDRLIDLCQELGRTEEAEAARTELQQRESRRDSPRLTVDRDDWVLERADLIKPWPSSRATDDDESDELSSTVRAPRRVGRNEACPCGSGKKYKKCCLQRTE